MKKITAFIAAPSVLLLRPPRSPRIRWVSPTAQKGIAKSSLSATPAGEWNRLGRRDGKFVELWTKDGDSLSKVSFFGGVPVGDPCSGKPTRRTDPCRKSATACSSPTFRPFWRAAIGFSSMFEP